MRLHAVLRVALPVVLAAHAAAGAADRDRCVGAAERAQWLRTAGKLVEALDALALCSNASCPGLVRRDCNAWRSEVEAILPSILVEARDARGAPIDEGRLTVDGRARTEGLGKEAIPLDPGPHTVRLDTPSGATEQQIVLHEGEQSARVALVVPSPPPPQAAVPPRAVVVQRPVPVSAYVLGGAGVASLGGSLFFEIKSLEDDASLHSSCSPRCSPSAAGSVRNEVIVTDVLLGAGVLSLAVATWMYLARPTKEDGAHAGGGPGIVFGIHAVRGGGAVQAAASF